MNYLKIVCFIFFVVFFATCSPPGRSVAVVRDAGLIVLDVLKAKDNPRDFPLSNLVKDVEFVVLESTFDSWCSRYSSIDLTQRYILVSSNIENKVLLFDRAGKFLRKIGARGKGPGEYLEPMYAAIDPNEHFIIVKDAVGGNLFKFDLMGKMVKQVDIKDLCPTECNSQPVFIDGNHFLLSFNRPKISTKEHYNLAVFDAELNLIDRFIQIPDNDSLPLINLSGQQITRGSQGCFYWENFVDTLYNIALDIKPRPEYYFVIGGNAPSLSFLKGQDRTKNGLEFNSVFGISDLSNYLLFNLLNNGTIYQIVYNKKNQELFCLSEKPSCENSPNGLLQIQSWDNDLFGYDKVWMNRYFPNENFMVYPINLEEALENTNLECLKNKDVLLPARRDQLVKLIGDSDGNELPVLVILFLK